MTEHAPDWDVQRERLSAYLDHRLSDAERQALAGHIAGCARCAAELAELRQVVSMLRALPAPVLPRSFALPVPEAARTGTATLVRAHERQAGARGRVRWAGLAQWAGGVAAAFGMVLLLGSFLAGGGIRLASYGGASATSGMPAQRPYVAQTAPSRPSDKGAGVVSTPAATQSGVPQGQPPTATPVFGGQTGTDQHAPEGSGKGGAGGATGLSLPPVNLPLTGAGLVVAGAATFAVGRTVRRRQRRAR